MELGEGWNNVKRGRRVVKATITPFTNPHSNPLPQPVTEAPEHSIVTTTCATAGPKKPEPKFAEAPKRAAGNSKMK